MVLHDQHVHSFYSKDSKEDIKNYINKARELGCSYFVTTEHVDLNICERGYDWLADYDKLIEFYKEYQKEVNDIKLLIGIEAGCKYDEKESERLYKILDKYPFDLINLSIHDFEDVDLYQYKYFSKYGVDKTLEIYYQKTIEGIKNFRDFDVLSHVDYAFKTVYLENKSLRISQYEELLKKVFNELIKRDKALEINTKVEEAINSDEHTRYLLRLYKSCGGVNLTLSSDAHTLDRYKSSFDKYLKIIKEEGFDHLNYFVNRKRYDFKI